MTADEIPEGTPDTVVARAARPPRVPVFDPTLGIDVPRSFRGTPPHRLAPPHHRRSGPLCGLPSGTAAVRA